jgi:hypothetical protein
MQAGKALQEPRPTYSAGANQRESIRKTTAAALYGYNKPLVIDELDLDGSKEGDVLVDLKAAGVADVWNGEDKPRK